MIGLRGVREVVVLFVSALPLLWVSGVVAFAVRAKNYLGYWPEPHHPDPQFIPFDFHYSMLALGLQANHVGLWMVLIAFAFRRRLTKWLSPEIRRVSLGVFLVGWFLILLMSFVPNIDFVHWFLD